MYPRLFIAGILFCYGTLFIKHTKCCTPGGGYRASSLRYRRINSNRIPDVTEDSFVASGSRFTRLKLGDESLVRVISTDIIFRDPKYDSEARLGIQSCTDSLTSLGVITKSYWRGQAVLYVTHGFMVETDEEAFKKNSLHYAGRAFDIQIVKLGNNTSRIERFKTPRFMLRKLALFAYYDAHFSFVEIKTHHIHVSCRKNAVKTEHSRCFHGDSYVRDINNNKRKMNDIKIGDRILTMSDTRTPVYSEVIMMLHRNEYAQVEDYVQIRTSNGKSLTLSSYHLIFISKTESIFSKDIKIGQNIITYNVSKDKFDISTVEYISGLHKRLGAYAPLTMEGTIVVDDVYTSCYALFPSHTISHAVFWLWRIVYPYLEFMNIQANYDGEYHWYADFFRKSMNYINIFPYSF